MREIVLDAEGWISGEEFCDALLGAIGAPSWHGRNANALIDSMIWGGINSLEPPYRIIVKNTQCLSEGIMNVLSQACRGFVDGRNAFRPQEGHHVDVSLEIVGGDRSKRRAGNDPGPQEIDKRAAAGATLAEDIERFRESLRPYAPIHVSQLHFEGFDHAADGGAERDDGEPPTD